MVGFNPIYQAVSACKSPAARLCLTYRLFQIPFEPVCHYMLMVYAVKMVFGCFRYRMFLT